MIKKVILTLMLLVAGIAYSQPVYLSPKQTTVGDTAYTGASNVQTGTIITSAYLRPYDVDIFGFKYPVMDSSSQFTVYMGVLQTDQISSVQIYPDTSVTFYFEVDSSAAGYVFIDPKFTEKFNYFQLGIPDTLFDNKTYYWLLQNRK